MSLNSGEYYISEAAQHFLSELGLGIEVLGKHIFCGPQEIVYMLDNEFVTHLVNCHELRDAIKRIGEVHPELAVNYIAGLCNNNCSLPIIKEVIIKNESELYLFNIPKPPLQTPTLIGRAEGILEESDWSPMSMQEARQIDEFILIGAEGAIHHKCSELDDIKLSNLDRLLFLPNSLCGEELQALIFSDC